MTTMRIGIIGAGMISDQYLSNLTRFPDVTVRAIGDLDADRAAAQASKWGVPIAGTPEAVLNDPDIELIINLTIPVAHTEVSTAILRAGKHVWSEKPIGVDRESAAALIAEADRLGLRLGVAPDTVLGPAWEAARTAVATGGIGTPISAVTMCQHQGPEGFHPNPDFLFATGGGPLFDMGPYYFTALVHLLGPVARVAATGRKARETRDVLTGPRTGQTFPVEVPTHLSVLLSFEGGAQAQSLLSFDTAMSRSDFFELHGSEGTMTLPDPNTFGGGVPVRIVRPVTEFVLPIAQDSETVWTGEPDVGRGLGVLDMARAIRAGEPHIATGEVGYHVLDILSAIEESAESGTFVPVPSTVPPLPVRAHTANPFAQTLND